jgi:hypothetical protein
MGEDSLDSQVNLDDLDLEGSFFIPTDSHILSSRSSSCLPSPNIKISDIQDEDDLKLQVENMHKFLLNHELTFIRSRHLSYVHLIQQEEEAAKHHELEGKKELEDGLKLASLVLDEISSETSINSPTNSILNLINVYNDKYQNLKYGSNTFDFPWPSLDDNVRLQCSNLLMREVSSPNDKKRNKDTCRAYLLGYLECLGRLPEKEMSNQGREFSNRISHISGRHPFGRVFTVLVISIKVLLKQVWLERLSGDKLCQKIEEIVCLLTNLWLKRYSPTFIHIISISLFSIFTLLQI